MFVILKEIQRLRTFVTLLLRTFITEVLCRERLQNRGGREGILGWETATSCPFEKCQEGCKYRLWSVQGGLAKNFRMYAVDSGEVLGGEGTRLDLYLRKMTEEFFQSLRRGDTYGCGN
jgi:hypothetical protein